MTNKKVSSESIKEFLEYKTLYYDKIDYTIISKSWEILSSHVKLPFIIHIVGTNGKGTTGRFLAHYLYENKKNVLHYTSPHIKEFNERIWINSKNITDDKLENSHKILCEILPLEYLEKLTYFEYTTLLALYASSGLDYLVLESGLGGEFDATNVVKNNLSLITNIGIDHTSFLGESIEEISLTKMRSVDTQMILGIQNNNIVRKIAEKIKIERNVGIIESDMSFNLNKLENLYPEYLLNNLRLSIKALQYLKFEINLKLFENFKFPGRYERVKNNIIVDVGHNPLAANEILKQLNKEKQKVTLVYNSYEDKDYIQVLTILKPMIKNVQIIEINDERMTDVKKLFQVCQSLDLEVEIFEKINETNNYLVFGSFLVVEKFMNILE